MVVLVVEGKGPCWLKTMNSKLNQQQQKVIFENGLGTVETYKSTLDVKSDAILKLYKPCPVSLAIRGPIGRDKNQGPTYNKWKGKALYNVCTSVIGQFPL